jgi:hypothetical protein
MPISGLPEISAVARASNSARDKFRLTRRQNRMRDFAHRSTSIFWFE